MERQGESSLIVRCSNVHEVETHCATSLPKRWRVMRACVRHQDDSRQLGSGPIAGPLPSSRLRTFCNATVSYITLAQWR
jgi:hypothetical protein